MTDSKKNKPTPAPGKKGDRVPEKKRQPSDAGEPKPARIVPRESPPVKR